MENTASLEEGRAQLPTQKPTLVPLRSATTHLKLMEKRLASLRVSIAEKRQNIASNFDKDYASPAPWRLAAHSTFSGGGHSHTVYSLVILSVTSSTRDNPRFQGFAPLHTGREKA